MPPSSVVALGIDPGLANAGLAVLEILPVGERLLHLAVLKTEKCSKKQNTLAADDDMRRVRELAGALWALVAEYKPRIFCLEAASWPRSATAAAKTAMSRGVIGAIAETLGIAIAQASPQEVKLAVTGRRDASKEDVERGICERFGNAEVLGGGIARGRREHCYDAAASVIACLPSAPVRMARAMLSDGVEFRP
jgi:crossover junction endodeoxyribonuclease RuvC